MIKRTPKRSDQELRNRVDLILSGGTPSAQMVKASLAPLLKKLKKQSDAKRAKHTEFVRYLRGMEQLQPHHPRPSRGEAKAAKAFKASLTEKAKLLKIAPPKFKPVQPQIRSGSIWTISSAPYTDRWNSGSGSSANHLLGNWSTASLDGGDSLAGVCMFFTPPPGRFWVRFAPYMPVSYNYRIDTSTPYISFVPSRAHARGFLGAFVSAFDGRQWIDIADVRNTVFDNSVSIRDDDSGSDDTAWYSPQAEFMTLGEPFLFALWAWGGVSTSTQDGTWPGWGFANAVMSASVPFMVVEQKV